MKAEYEQKQYRQGDVLIERVPEFEGEFKRQRERVILAHGEATGHAHSIEPKRGATVWRQENEDGSFFLRIEGNVEVEHQEHAPIALPAGTYRVRRQREYSPEAIRNVAD